MSVLARFLVLLPLLTVALACSGDDSSDSDVAGTTTAAGTTTVTGTTTAETTTAQTTTSEAPPAPRLGAVVEADGVRYEVVDATTSKRLATDLPSADGGFEFNVTRKGVRYGAAASGVYVVVHVKHTGARKELQDFLLVLPAKARVPADKLKPVTEKLLDGRGKVRSADGFNVVFTGQPEAATELRAAFDVPAWAVAGSKLRVRIGRTTKTVDLGLD